MMFTWFQFILKFLFNWDLNSSRKEVRHSTNLSRDWISSTSGDLEEVDWLVTPGEGAL